MEMTGMLLDSMEKMMALTMPPGAYEAIDITSGGDKEPQQITNCRAILADVSGWIKIDYQNNEDSGETYTEVLYLIGGVEKLRRNVKKVYRYLAGTTTTEMAQIRKSDNTQVNGIKLLR